MSEKNLEHKNTLSLYVIILLSLLLFISMDFNIRYFLAGQAGNAGTQSPTTGDKKATQALSFQANCKHYGFLHQSEYLPLSGMKPDSQNLLGVDGEIEKIEANLWVIVPEPRSSLMLYMDAKTKLAGSFKPGDCVRAVYAGDSSNKALLIEPQP